MRTGIGIGIQGSTPKASDPPIQAFQGKSSGSGGTPALTITINALADMQGGRLNSDGNYYNIEFPGDYIGTRGDVGTDPFEPARTGTGPIDYAGTLDVIFNIPVGMSIGGNTSGTFGSKSIGGVHPAAGAKYELRRDWVSACTSPSFGQYVSDPSLVINLDTDEWDSLVFPSLSITVNNHGNTIGAGGSGGFGGARSTNPNKYIGGGGGGGGMGLHPDPWPAGTRYESTDNFSSGDFIAGQAGSGWRTGTASGWGSDGVQGTSDAAGTPGPKGSGSTGQTGSAGHGHAGGTAIYVQSNVASPTTGTTLTIINGPTGRMYGGGGGGGGGFSEQGGAGADMRNGVVADGLGTNPGIGGWWGSILWVDSANLTVSNTITNENSSYVVIGWDGRWA